MHALCECGKSWIAQVVALLSLRAFQCICINFFTWNVSGAFSSSYSKQASLGKLLFTCLLMHIKTNDLFQRNRTKSKAAGTDRIYSKKVQRNNAIEMKRKSCKNVPNEKQKKNIDYLYHNIWFFGIDKRKRRKKLWSDKIISFSSSCRFPNHFFASLLMSFRSAPPDFFPFHHFSIGVVVFCSLLSLFFLNKSRIKICLHIQWMCPIYTTELDFHWIDWCCSERKRSTTANKSVCR